MGNERELEEMMGEKLMTMTMMMITIIMNKLIYSYLKPKSEDVDDASTAVGRKGLELQ